MNNSPTPQEPSREAMELAGKLAFTKSISLTDMAHLIDAHCAKQNASANEKMEYVRKMGLRFGMMRTSDKPEPYLAHVWDEGSDHERMFREWSHSIGWEDEVAKLKAELSSLRARANLADEMAGALERLGSEQFAGIWALNENILREWQTDTSVDSDTRANCDTVLALNALLTKFNSAKAGQK